MLAGVCYLFPYLCVGDRKQNQHIAAGFDLVLVIVICPSWGISPITQWVKR